MTSQGERNDVTEGGAEEKNDIMGVMSLGEGGNVTEDVRDDDV